MADMWSLIHMERDAIADDLADIDATAWTTTSLCPDWNVGQVVAHMTSAAMMTPPQFIAKWAASGFRFNAYANKEIDKYYSPTPAETLERFRSAAHGTNAPPGPTATWIGEAVVHSEDIRRPLGIQHDYDMDALRGAADFYTGSNLLIGSKSRIAGVRLEATDADWAHGEGPTANGPMLALVMAMTGRTTYLDSLTGEGVAQLRGRG